jgi:hypothetical protein
MHILDKNGNNLSGANVPGTPVAGGPGFDGVTNVSIAVTVTSDQPIVVGSDFQWSGFHPLPCSLLPK